jgi:UDP-glucose 4-epimerase
MKKVVVFGGSGFLGSYVADELTLRGYEVVIADIKPSPFLSEKQSFVHCDIMDEGSVAAILKDAVLVYNFAGLADIDESIHLPKVTMEQNVIGNINILEACRELSVERYVYASSAYAFSEKGSFYGISKLTSEKIIEEYESRFGLPYSIVRYGSLYGERADEHNGIYRMLHQALNEGKIRHNGDGEEVREYIHAIDAARMSVDIVEDDAYRDQHLILTGVERMKQKDLLHMIKEIMNDDIEISYADSHKEGHYQVTPYSFHPNMARKLVLNSFIDLGQGLVECVRKIHASISSDGR